MIVRILNAYRFILYDCENSNNFFLIFDYFYEKF